MAALIKSCFTKKKREGDRQKVSLKNLQVDIGAIIGYALFFLEYEVSVYDKTYEIPMSILKLVGLRIQNNQNIFVRFCWNSFYWFEFINLFGAMVLELMKMVQTAGGGSFQDAVEIFRMMPCVGYLILAMAKSYKLVCNRSVYENLMSELRDMWPRGEVGEDEHRVISKSLYQLNILGQGYYWCNNALLVIFLSPPFVEITKRAYGHDVPLILPFFYWFPFDPFQRWYYEVILALQTWHGLITIWFMLCGDLLFCIFLSHIITQFDLLSMRITNMVQVSIDSQLLDSYPLGVLNNNSETFALTYSFEEQESQLKKELDDIILRHRALIRLAGDVEGLFSLALLMNLLNSSIIICFCGFCCVIVEKLNEMVYKSFLTTALTQTWLLCWYGQRLLESSEAVSSALYNSGWYNVSTRIRSTILVMILRAQKQVRVTTYGFSVISLASYTTIIKSSWSYFTLLLNIYKRD